MFFNILVGKKAQKNKKKVVGKFGRLPTNAYFCIENKNGINTKLE